jgi:hypothetical protein
VQVHYSKFPLTPNSSPPEQRFVAFDNPPHEQRIISPNIGHYISNSQFMEKGAIPIPKNMPYIQQNDKIPYKGKKSSQIVGHLKLVQSS